MAYSKYNKKPTDFNQGETRLYPLEDKQLDSLSVFIEDEREEYFDITGIPEVAGYGKHGFFISTFSNTPENIFEHNSDILYEVKDAEGNIIFSDVANFLPVDGSTLAYFWIREDPLRIYDDIQDGIATLTIVGTLQNVPSEWKHKFNIRYTKNFKIKKSYKNTSDLIFKWKPSVSVAETVNRDTILPAGGKIQGFQRSYLNFRFNNLSVYSGKLDAVEIYYSSAAAGDSEPQLLDKVKLKPNQELNLTGQNESSFWQGNLTEIEGISGSFHSGSQIISNYYGAVEFSSGDSLETLYPEISSSAIGSGSVAIHNHDVELSAPGIQLGYVEKVTDINCPTDEIPLTIKFDVSGTLHTGFYGVDQRTLSPTSQSGDGLRTLYEYQWSNYNPSSSAGPFINQETFPEYDGYYTQEDFILPRDYYLKYRFSSLDLKSGASRTGYINNISIKQTPEKGINPYLYFKKIILPDSIRRKDNLTFTFKFIGENGQEALNYYPYALNSGRKGAQRIPKESRYLTEVSSLSTAAYGNPLQPLFSSSSLSGIKGAPKQLEGDDHIISGTLLWGYVDDSGAGSEDCQVAKGCFESETTEVMAMTYDPELGALKMTQNSGASDIMQDGIEFRQKGEESRIKISGSSVATTNLYIAAKPNISESYEYIQYPDRVLYSVRSGSGNPSNPDQMGVIGMLPHGQNQYYDETIKDKGVADGTGGYDNPVKGLLLGIVTSGYPGGASPGDGFLFISASDALEGASSVGKARVGIGTYEPKSALHVCGSITADEYIISSSVYTSSVIYQSGSTIAGNTYDDVHSFTGSLKVSSSLTVTGSVYVSESLIVGHAREAGSSEGYGGQFTASFTSIPGQLTVGDFFQGQAYLDFQKRTAADVFNGLRFYRHTTGTPEHFGGMLHDNNNDLWLDWDPKRNMFIGFKGDTAGGNMHIGGEAGDIPGAIIISGSGHIKINGADDPDDINGAMSSSYFAHQLQISGGVSASGYMQYGEGHIVDGNPARYSILGGHQNTISGSDTGNEDEDCMIVGGITNIMSGSTRTYIIGADSAFIEGGNRCMIVGGNQNKMSGSAQRYQAMYGGSQNLIYGANDNCQYSAIVGGVLNEIKGAGNAFIAGGRQNFISSSGDGNADSAGIAILGGYKNKIINPLGYDELFGANIIAGGLENEISASPAVGGSGVYASAIIAGYQNKIYTAEGITDQNRNDANIIVGGYQNKISDSLYSSIHGGAGNIINNANTSSIIGGISSSINENHHNTHIIGSNLTTVDQNTTYTENIIAKGNISSSGNLYLENSASIHFRHFETGSTAYNHSYDASGDAEGDIVKFGTVNTGTMAAGKMYYLNTSGQWVLTDASDNTAGADELLAVALGDDPVEDGMLLRGIVRMAAAPGDATGTAIYMSETAGAVTITKPSSSTNIVRICGYVLSNDQKLIYFNPSTTWIKIV